MVKPAHLNHHSTEEVSEPQPGSIVKGSGNTVILTNSEPGQSAVVEILDIRRSDVKFSLEGDILKGLDAPMDEKTLPTLLLYNNAGLREFENITYCEDYYLTNSEIEVLETHAAKIAECIPSGAVLIELGSGNLRKVNILLKALEDAKKTVDYFALDLDRSELERTFRQLPKESFRHVRCHGLHGTYDDGRAWLQSCTSVKNRPRIILWLGSSVGNYDRPDAAEFLACWRSEVLRPGSADRVLIGIDSCTEPARVWRAYNDSEGVTERFIMNGLSHANSILNRAVFNPADFEYYGEYDVKEDRHQAFYKAKKDLSLQVSNGVAIVAGEKIRIERSYKYSPTEFNKLFEDSSLATGCVWGNARGDYNLHLLYAPVAEISLLPKEYARDQHPEQDEWEALWALWDAITTSMIAKSNVGKKPIDLRNPIVFYFGHIPAFCDLQVAKVDGRPLTEPSAFMKIFQRGIDPDVDDPSKCHDHSEAPLEWPTLSQIDEYKCKIRARIAGLYRDGRVINDVALKRGLWLAFEHEVMHLETLLYMLIQDSETLPPLGVPRPDFAALAAVENASTDSSMDVWIDIPSNTVKVGATNNEEKGGEFGWDNERPLRYKTVKAFKAFTRPISNAEYLVYLTAVKSVVVPKSWLVTKGEVSKEGIMIKTFFGPVPFELAACWAVSASYDELNACATWMGGRLPTREELTVIYDHVSRLKEDSSAARLAARFSAVNGHLSNNGINVTPPPLPQEDNNTARLAGGESPFTDLRGANVSFRHWHPTSVVGKLCGRGDGGLWEWTSTVLQMHEGFAPMEEYPEYTADFFDGKHNVVMGGSWATHSRIAGRKSFVNWYQRAYPYAWCTARLVRDAPASIT